MIAVRRWFWLGVVASLLMFQWGYAAQAGLPRLVDLGADKCVPCKMMAPILDELQQSLAGQLEVEFIDVWKKRERAEEFSIRMIPTQIFYDPSGKELFRHQGFYSKQQILDKWAELGFDFSANMR